MMWSPETKWKPTRLMEVAGSIDTSTGAIEVTTDAGPAYIKPMGNRLWSPPPVLRGRVREGGDCGLAA